MREFIIELDKLTPSNNKLKRMHWAAYKRLKKEFLDLLCITLPHDQRTFLRPGTQITITRYGIRQLDKDNLYGGCKPLIDCLQPWPQGIGLITDDDPDTVTIRVKQEKVTKKKDQKVEIHFKEVPEDG